jgi:TolA-binding protein
MRHGLSALTAAAAAMVLAQCAGFTPVVQRGVDLYETDAYFLARGRLEAAAGEIVLPLPLVGDAIEEVAQPAAVVVAAAAAPAAAAAEEPASEAPAGPGSHGAVEVGVVSRPELAAKTAAVLPTPVPPAVRASAATVGGSASPAPAKPAAGAGAAKPAGSGTAAAANATAPAAAKPASAAVAATAARKAREVYARVGDEIEIGLDGVGYLFLGFADRQTDGMTFRARTVKDGRTFFTFKALKLGSWDLDFQQQDAATGASRMESVRVVVLEEADFAEAVQRQTERGGEPVLGDIETGRFEWAEKLAALGKETAAIAEYLKGYREGNPELNDRIAQLYARTGEAAAAEKYWRKNVGAAAPWGDRAVVGIARLAVAGGDLDAYLAWHRQLLGVSAEPIDDVLVDAALVARAQGDVGLGMDLLSEYGRRYPKGKRLDEATFVTAQLLEADSPFRDLKRSRDLYAALLREFPESSRAAEAAERLRYLNEHFFTIR